MRSNIEETHRMPERRFQNAMQYSWRGSGSMPAGWGQPDLRQALGRLFTSGDDNRAHVSSFSDYFQDILHSASNLNWEFKRLDLMFSSKVNQTFQSNENPSKHSVSDLMHFRHNVKAVLKLIRNLKEDLKFREHYVRMEGHNSSFDTRFVIEELETKLNGLVGNVDRIKSQLPVEFMQRLESIPKPTSRFDEEDLANKHYRHGHCNHVANWHHQCQRVRQQSRENDHSETKHYLNHNVKFKTPKLKARLNPHEVNGMEINDIKDKKTHCMKQKKLQSHSFCELQESKTIDKKPRCLKQKQNSNHHSNDFKASKTKCKNTRCLKQLNPQNCSSDESQPAKLPFKEAHCFKQKQCLRRPKYDENTSRLAKKHHSVTQLYIKEPFTVKSSLPHMHTVENGFQDITNNYNSENGHTSDIQCKKTKVRRKRRERTRAGKDYERVVRSESNIYWQKNKVSGIYDDGYNKEIINIGGHLFRDNSNNIKSYFRSNNCKEKWGIFGEREINEIISSRVRCEPRSIKERRRRRRRRRRQRVKWNEQRLCGGAHQSMFSVKISPKRRRKIRRRGPERKRIRRVKLKPSQSSVRVDSSEPSRRRNVDRRRRRRKGLSKRPKSVITYRQWFDGENSMYHPPSDYSAMTFDRDEFGNSCPAFTRGSQWSYPIDNYPRCGPQYVSGYRPIPYPMCSYPGCTATSPVRSERFSIEFERPRRKKIVKRHLPTRCGKKVYHELDLGPRYSTQDKELQWGKYAQPEDSYTGICYGPPDTENQCSNYCNKYYERDRLERENTPVNCKETSTEIVTTTDNTTSTYDIIRAVRAVATNTTSVATRDTAVSTDIDIPCPPPPETRNKRTNTEKLRSRSVGVDVKLEEKTVRVMSNKATDTPLLKKMSRGTNTVFLEGEKKVKDVGTNPRPQEKKKVINVGTETVTKRVESKFTNTIPLKEEGKRIPWTVSKGTQIWPVLTAVKQTSYDKVKTLDDGTNTVPKKMIHKGQQFESIDPIRMKAKSTEQPVGYTQFLEIQRSENTQTVSKQHLHYKHVLGKGEKGHVQYLRKQPEEFAQNISKQPVAYSQMMETLKIKHSQNLFSQTKIHVQTLNKQSLENVQRLDQQSVGHLQFLGGTRIELSHTLDEKKVGRLQILEKQPIKHLHLLSKQSVETLQITKKQPVRAPPAVAGPTPQIATRIKQPVKHVQVLSKNPPKYIHTKKKESSSDMSVHLTVEKIHEEVFRKRCRFCKCREQCRCRCCNKNIIVCEKKKSNTIRITNKSECKLLKEGEKIVSDVDVDVAFNVANSRSSGKIEERPETEPEVEEEEKINAYFTSMCSLNTSALDDYTEMENDWKYTNYEI